MDELFPPIPFETFDALPEGCRYCPLARFTIEQLVKIGEDPQHAIDDIQENCPGWQDDQYPVESVLSSEGTVLDLVAVAIEENCPYDMGNMNNPAMHSIVT